MTTLLIIAAVFILCTKAGRKLFWVLLLGGMGITSVVLFISGVREGSAHRWNIPAAAMTQADRWVGAPSSLGGLALFFATLMLTVIVIAAYDEIGLSRHRRAQAEAKLAQVKPVRTDKSIHQNEATVKR